MKKIKYIIMAMTGVLFASCMGSDYAEPASKQPEIKQTNVISIDSLKTIKEYSTAINGNSYKEITEDIQILATVTGNDAQGNFYNQSSSSSRFPVRPARSWRRRPRPVQRREWYRLRRCRHRCGQSRTIRR